MTPESLDALFERMKGYPDRRDEPKFWMSSRQYDAVRRGGEGWTADGMAYEARLGLTERAKRWKAGRL